MRNSLIAVLVVAALGPALLGFTGQARALDDAPPSGQSTAQAKPETLAYKPPMLGAPRLRVGGGVRGGDLGEAPVLQVLAPLQNGQTTVEQPVLYWHLDRASKHSVEITIMAAGEVSPLVRQVLPGPIAAGLHAWRLADQEKRLEIGKEYEWFVAVMLDPAQRSKDIIAGGGLTRVAAPPGLTERLQSAKGSDLGPIYAGAGLWYDAINAFVEGVGKEADKAALTSQLTAILAQEEISGIGLTAPGEKK